MNKIWLIVQREFLNRVQKKSFLIATILVPLIFPTIIAGLFWFMIREVETAKPEVVHVLDESGKFTFTNTKRFIFIEEKGVIDSAKKTYSATKDFALLYIPSFDLSKPDGFTIYMKENQSDEKISGLERILEDRIRDLKLEQYQIDKETLAGLKTSIDFKQVNISDTGEEKSSNSMILKILGFLLGIVLFVFVLSYGMQIMQGVIDEKTSKIVEVIVSSVKPIQLMLGKIIGIASVGLVQFTIWIVLITVLSSTVLSYFGLKMPQEQMQEQVMSQVDPEQKEEIQKVQSDKMNEVLNSIDQIPFTKIALVFLFYFLGGYLMYGALFAAVGSAVDSIQESQQFQMPLMLPLMISYMSVFTVVPINPHGSLSFWLSIIPLTSPVVMVARIAYDVPTWELILSMVLLVAGFIFTTWVAGRIYRVGILMTGSKVNYKVLAKWFMIKN
ncbi:ABC transporter permease [Chryseotalea sanaruensis]|uniref:ABC transporter permease n=1 Tax=Chryseotalea sanaruensis TaxID=2482724 RepID=A0A401UB99_9BACT|nr:ABC transporter permease [Chryseotalea sanaruensis]GCC52183.1 ABC transporter permease [Chryseotalea sanaruensis]